MQWKRWRATTNPGLSRQSLRDSIASNRRMARRHSPPPAPLLRNWPVGLPRHPGTNAGTPLATASRLALRARGILRPTRMDTKSYGSVRRGQGSRVGERNCFLFPFPIRVACEAGVFVCGEGCIRGLAGGESPKGWLWRSPSREGRWGKWVSCEWVSGGVGKRPSSGDGARHRQSRLRDSPPGQGSWSRVSANRICWHIWNCICGIAARMVFRAPAHKNLCAPTIAWQSHGALIFGIIVT